MVQGEGSEEPFAGVSLRFSLFYWPDTDFTRHNVDYGEIRGGGPRPDGIPAIDDPQFESIESANSWIADDSPVMFFEHNGDARAYPIGILIWHEIVNVTQGGLEVSVTFCPLCNATFVFNRNLDNGLLVDFGTSGNLRNSDLIMYDRQTFSFWQQFTGQGIVGELTGTQLEILPSQIIAWRDFKAGHPDGVALARPRTSSGTFIRSYGSNPYGGYDRIGSNPFLFEGIVDGRLAATERVVAVEQNGVDIVYPFTALREVNVVNDSVGGQPLVVFWKEGTNSAFNNLDTGSTGVFSTEFNDQLLTFEALDDGSFRDIETGTLWTITGQASEGPLAPGQLTRLNSGEHFWFAWAAFKPETLIWLPPDREPPKVARVMTSSFLWDHLFERRVTFVDQSAGVVIRSGPDHVDSLPWSNLNQFSIDFSEDVIVGADDLHVIGVNAPSHIVSGFNYDPITFTATWSFQAPFVTDKLLLVLAADITDKAGHVLDGEQNDGKSVLSGDGEPGGQFTYRVNINVGDIDADGTPTILDLAPLRSAIGSTATNSRFVKAADIDGDGQVSATDVSLVRTQLGLGLPAGEPVLPAAAASLTAQPPPEGRTLIRRARVRHLIDQHIKQRRRHDRRPMVRTPISIASETTLLSDSEDVFPF